VLHAIPSLYPPANEPDDGRTGLTVEALKHGILDNLFFALGRFPDVATRHDSYLALAYAVRDRLLCRWVNTLETYYRQRSRTVCYLSAEFLLGPHLGNNLINLGVLDEARQATSALGLDLDELLEQEDEPGLGNGGLGRLAACYLDSLATLQIPTLGYGIRYEFGIFQQAIRDGWQVEVTDKWLGLSNPWEIPRPEIAFEVGLGGRTEHYQDEHGRCRVRWIPHRMVKGVAYDTPILGYKVCTASLLRLWKAEAWESFDLETFNVGDYYGAVNEKVVSENITKVLYPNDEPLRGRELRLGQQYFFVSCSLQDMIRLHLQTVKSVEGFEAKFAVQLNDTHPSIAVAELMRLLVDVHLVDWDQAWQITTRTLAYTNHTLLPEALETWSVPLFASVLPRHLEIIYEINHRFLDEVRTRFPGDEARVRRMSLIDEGGERYVRMAHLAVVGSHAINGVARLHTELLQGELLRDFWEMWPQKFSNKTNGVTPRRFLVLANPRLACLVTDTLGDERWVCELERLRELEPHAHRASFRETFRMVKRENKRDLARFIQQRTGVGVDPDSLFDVQVKRFHEYKRQHLNMLHVITLYLRLLDHAAYEMPPRTVLLAGKAAPSYRMAKIIIKLVHAVADVVNTDPRTHDRLRVVFLPDYNVRLAQRILPAAELSQQISTAGKEASGTGNMKLAMNGALTLGTLDGANIEIREEVGADNFFLFGLSADEVLRRQREGYRSRDYYEHDPELRAVLDELASGRFSGGDRELFRPLVQSLLEQDPYMLLADYRSYVDQQTEVGRAFLDRDRWTTMSVLNVARMGKFSSDRAIREYCEDIWKVAPVPIG
jgi:starch phosphorylase